jgi:hypothetical protein
MDPLSEIEAEHTRRSLQTLEGAIERTVQSPWKRRLWITLAVVFLAAMLTVTAGTIRAVHNSSAAARCPAEGTVTSRGWLSRKLWWFTVTNYEQHCRFSVYTNLDGYVSCELGDDYPTCIGRGGGGGHSW